MESPPIAETSLPPRKAENQHLLATDFGLAGPMKSIYRRLFGFQVLPQTTDWIFPSKTSQKIPVGTNPVPKTFITPTLPPTLPYIAYIANIPPEALAR